MSNQNVYLVSKYSETKGDISLLGIADCRFRADRMIATDIQRAPITVKVKYENELTHLSDATGNLLITYTITEIPLNEQVDISEF